MNRLSPPIFLCAALALLSACGGAPPPEAEQLAPPLGSMPDTPSLMEVRTLRVLWAGAEGALSAITRSEEDARERARTISALLRAPGSNFGEVARQYGDVPPRVQRIDQETADPAIFAAAASLRVGEVSRPIRTDAGFVVLTRRADPLPGPRSIVARHILIAYDGARRAQPGVTRSREEAAQLASQIRGEVLEGIDWIALHGEFSDEPSGPGSEPGGQLPEFGRGQMAPSFERAAFALEVGTTSEVVETPFGFHVIQRLR
ncbi:MAG: peptidylprolyl isomerase [Myxococcota bacterium]